MRTRLLVGLTGAALGLVGLQASAHHGWAGQQTEQFELTGKLQTDVSLAGAHGSMQIVDDKGQVWDITLAPACTHGARRTEARRDSDGRDRDGQRASQQRHEALRGQDRARHAQRQELRRLSGPSVAVRPRLALGSAARLARGLGPRAAHAHVRRVELRRRQSRPYLGHRDAVRLGARARPALARRSGAACRSRRSRRPPLTLAGVRIRDRRCEWRSR